MWGLPVTNLYYHVDRLVAAESYPLSLSKENLPIALT